MLGTMPDFSQAKHIELSNNGELLASVFGNSFGDQIIYYRHMVENDKWQGYETLGVSVNHEGNHIKINEMLLEALKLKKSLHNNQK